MCLLGCATSGPVANNCDQWSPIYLSTQDQLTMETARQIYIHNEKGALLCEWGSE